jgi:2-polyprenyl-3-methyl-5-hydroxy-6-metoxy-1,4-benzoquinol methylase
MTSSGKLCILCGHSERFLLYSENNWHIYKCAACGLGILDPQPQQDQLSNLYNQTYFENHYKEELQPDSDEMIRRLKQESHRLRFFRPYKKTGRVLDIGCGRGYFLLVCRQQNYSVEGIDVSDNTAAYVNLILDIPVHVGFINNIALADAAYDVVTMWHSLEHTSDPHACIQMARRWLKEDGILVVDVPNHEGFDARKMWSKWPQWDLPFHFYHFTPRSLSALLEKHGFEIVHHKSYLSEYVKEKLQKASIPSTLARIIAQFYSGGSYAVVARKRDAAHG